MEYFLILLLVLAHALDGYTTYLGLNGGGAKEMNPVGRFIFGFIGTSLIAIAAYKAVIVVAFILLARAAPSETYFYVAYIVGIVVGLAVGVWNLNVLEDTK